MPTESNPSPVEIVSVSSRAEVEKTVEPIIRKCLREFGDYTINEVSDADFAAYTQGMFQPDVRRVSLFVSLAQSLLGASATGEGLEVGSGYGYLLFPMALYLPQVRWSAVDHPGRTFVNREDYRKTFREYRCQFSACDIVRDPLPFPDANFLVVTFSEVLEHLPVERLTFVLSELGRVVRPGGLLLVSTPNQASLENRLRLLKGKSILDMPNELDSAKGMFGHIRLYTTSEMEAAMSKLGFFLERSLTESNAAGYRGSSAKSFRSRIHRLYERAEAKIGFLRCMGDTWYMAFRKAIAEDSAPQLVELDKQPS